MCFSRIRLSGCIYFSLSYAPRLSLGGYFTSANTVSNKILLAGYSISPALVIWYFFINFLKTRLKDQQYFASIFLSLIVCFLVGYKRNGNGEAKIYHTDRIATCKRYGRNESFIRSKVVANDQYQTQVFIRVLMDWMVQQRQWYDEELNKTKWDQLFAVERINPTKNLAESKDIIQKLKRLYASFVLV